MFKIIVCLLSILMFSSAWGAGKYSKTVDADGTIHLKIKGDTPAVSRKGKTSQKENLAPYKSELDDICNNVPVIDDSRTDIMLQGYMYRADGLKPIIENEKKWASYKESSLRMLASCKDRFRLELRRRDQERKYNELMDRLKRRSQ